MSNIFDDPFDDYLEIDSGDEGSAFSVNSTLVIPKDCAVLSSLSVTELLRKGMDAIALDIEDPIHAVDRANAQVASDGVRKAFSEGQPVTVTITLVPESFREVCNKTPGLGDDGRLLN